METGDGDVSNDQTFSSNNNRCSKGKRGDVLRDFVGTRGPQFHRETWPIICLCEDRHPQLWALRWVVVAASTSRTVSSCPDTVETVPPAT